MSGVIRSQRGTVSRNFIGDPSAAGHGLESDSFAPSGLEVSNLIDPTAYAVGCILSPLRGSSKVSTTPCLNNESLLNRRSLLEDVFHFA